MDITEQEGSSNQAEERTPTAANKNQLRKQKPAAQELLDILDAAQCEFWCTPDGEAYATVTVEDVLPLGELTIATHKENWRLEAEYFTTYMSSLYYDRHRHYKTLDSQTIARVLGVLRVKARRGGRYPSSCVPALMKLIAPFILT